MCRLSLSTFGRHIYSTLFSYIGGNYNFAEYLRMPFMPAASEMFVVCAAKLNIVDC
jgi:hypothetical protein